MRKLFFVKILADKKKKKRKTKKKKKKKKLGKN